MNKTIITLAAALLLGTSWAAFAQEDPTLIVPDGQPGAGQQDGQQPQKKRKKREAEQPSAEQQSEQPQPEKKRRKKQAEQPDDSMQPSGNQQFEQPQPEKKRKKKQAEQPDDSLQQPSDNQQYEQPQPEKKRKKKQQAEQPGQQPVEEQLQQQTEPVKKKKKKQAEEPIQQPVDQQAEQPGQQPGDQQAEQPQSGKKKKKNEQAEQPVETQPSTSEQTTGEPKSGKPAAGVPPEVSQYLSDTRPASELSDAELAQRVKAGRGLVRMKGLPDDVRQDLAGRAKQARSEAIAREQGKGGGKAGKQPELGQPTGEQPTAEQPAGEQPVTGEPQKGNQGQEVVPSDQAGQPPVTLDKKDVEKFDNNKTSPQAEAKAKAYLDDRSADRLKDDEAKTRLDGMRDLLSDNELSRDTKRELRRKLKEERDAYRNRVAEKVVVEEKKGDQKDRMPRRRDRDNDRRWDNWAKNDILRDRRRSDELEEGELRRRIDIYREAIYDDRYSDDERGYWRDMMDRDRRYLGDRMRRDRGDRERYWRDRRDNNELNIDINIILSGDREPPPSAFMDEIDDEELEDYLVAAPRQKVARRYTVAEIEEEPDVRTAMPAIEIDNIHFGFNESFMREEEVENLDRIAEVVEKILAGHPDEVFMIEGHTDAVGSDAYNLKLSRERAQAVKKALTTYYVIPARNLVTAGYGERYLKIPTAEPEEENRRVSFRRVTPLVGEAE